MASFLCIYVKFQGIPTIHKGNSDTSCPIHVFLVGSVTIVSLTEGTSWTIHGFTLQLGLHDDFCCETNRKGEKNCSITYQYRMEGHNFTTLKQIHQNLSGGVNKFEKY